MAGGVPFLDLGAAHAELREELDAAALRVLHSGRYVLGPEVEAFEAAFASWVGTREAVGVASGLDALTLALRSPGATVWAVDVNARARELTARNAERNGLTNVRVAAPDDVPADVAFAAIWSNPPIRIGKAALHELLLRWLARLAPDGVATMVVQKHLGADSLQVWLAGQGYPTERVASRQGFRVLQSRRAA